MPDPILELDGVGKHFGGVVVLQDVSFHVARGARHALIGPNGAGKTTLFNVISGVFPPDEGTVKLNGRDLAGVPSRRRIAMGMARSFQNIRLMPHLSVVENVMLGQHARQGLLGQLKPVGLLPQARERRAALDLLDAFGLDAYPGQVVANLPYGIRKKIEVVRALMAEPELLLLDEPAAGLNPTETAALRDFLMEVSARGVTLLVVEHDMPFVNSLCEHVTVMNFGRLIYDGTAAGVREDEAVLEAYLGHRRKGATNAA
ncbi:ABC transporter ATP-binding protein [Rhodosalinus halophilus]|jgi:branched-chain amino acid transport system ATP-binding protein|uniref:ABC transporter ATP-binding protein n=1 Tax=Rhodosalinus halophilus TaxID=2259333 RepID=A0A365UAW6_9RHOB|nr:ABC transporter ATP-binding protein [Rhodosalinus halophilus]RBI86325.1 ABC transporter ATP-binding protein [Rhodosalinus halophilus]